MTPPSALTAPPLRPGCPACHSNEPCKHDGSTDILSAYSRATYSLARLAGAVEDYIAQIARLDAFVAEAPRSSVKIRRQMAVEERARASEALRKVFTIATGRVLR